MLLRTGAAQGAHLWVGSVSAPGPERSVASECSCLPCPSRAGARRPSPARPVTQQLPAQGTALTRAWLLPRILRSSSASRRLTSSLALATDYCFSLFLSPHPPPFFLLFLAVVYLWPTDSPSLPLPPNPASPQSPTAPLRRSPNKQQPAGLRLRPSPWRPPLPQSSHQTGLVALSPEPDATVKIHVGR